MGRDSRERKTLGGKGSVQTTSRLFSDKTFPRSSALKEGWARLLSTTRWQEWATQRLHLSPTLQGLFPGQSVGTFCRRQCNGRPASAEVRAGVGRILRGLWYWFCAFPQPWLREGMTPVKGVKVSRLVGQNSTSKGLFSVPSTSLPAFYGHFLSIYCVPGMC